MGEFVNESEDEGDDKGEEELGDVILNDLPLNIKGSITVHSNTIHSFLIRRSIAKRISICRGIVPSVWKSNSGILLRTSELYVL